MIKYNLSNYKNLNYFFNKLLCIMTNKYFINNTSNNVKNLHR